MPKKTKNKCQRIGSMETEQSWFIKRRIRTRMRNKMAKLSRSKNR